MQFVITIVSNIIMIAITEILHYITQYTYYKIDTKSCTAIMTQLQLRNINFFKHYLKWHFNIKITLALQTLMNLNKGLPTFLCG